MRFISVKIRKLLKTVVASHLSVLIVLGLFVVGIAMPTQVQAYLTIEITRGNDKALPVAVVPFAWSGNGILPKDMSGIIAADLQLSGKFRALDRGDYQSFPSQESEVYYRDWNMLGTSFLIIGNVDPQKKYKNKVNVNYQLFDIQNKKVVFSETINGNKDAMIDLAHHISDQIYKKITGVRGIFSTKILYVEAIWKNDSDDQTVDDVDYKLIYSDVDGARPRVILKSKEPILSPTWSPNGKHVAYVSFESGRPAIYIQTLSNGKREQLTGYRGLNSAPVWSPDGKTMAVILSKSGSADLYTLDIKTKRLKRLTTHFAIDNEPAWAPSGKEIYFTSDRGGTAQIYRMAVPSGTAKRISFKGVFNARAKPTPDGKAVVMIHKADRSSDGYNVGVLDLRTNRFRILASQRFTDSPTVSPNGEMVMYAAQEDKKGVLGITSLDGRASYRLPSSKGDVREPAWSPFDVNVD